MTKKEIEVEIEELEQLQIRYIEAERFIVELKELNWFSRLFLYKRKINKFLQSRLIKFRNYNF